MRSVVKALAKGLTTTVIFFLLAEIGLRGAYLVRNSMVEYVPLAYTFGDDDGPLPPWVDAWDILKDDQALIWRNAPNVHRTYLDMFSPAWTESDRIALLRRFVPTLPERFRDSPKWEIRLNSEGYRGDEMSAARPPSTVRIACLGDSWTFGMPVDQDQSYPSRLAAWLRQERSATKYEVQNFGVMGYSSFQGLQVMKSRVLDLDPDIVVIGFGMNDSEVAGYRDKDMVAAPERPSWPARIKNAMRSAVQQLESYKLLKYEALVLRFHPRPVSDHIKAEAEAKGSDSVDYDSIEPWTRVSPHDYESNIREMVRLAREHGASVVLVDNELWEESPYRAILKSLAIELDAPLVDSLAIVNAERGRIEQSLETRLALEGAGRDDHLPASPEGKTTMVFRMYRGSEPVPKGLSIVGPDPQLGALVPNEVAMHDDGLGGDQRGGDGVWTYTAAFKPSTTVFYVYTNSGAQRQWEGLDVPYVRRVHVPAAPDGGPVYMPIETFGRVYMLGDGWHTDAVGYDAIGHAVARAIAMR